MAGSPDPATPPLWAIIDAYRGQVFAAKFRRDDAGKLETLVPTHARDNDAFLAALVPRDHVTGPGLERLAAQLPAGVTRLPSELWAPDARSVGEIALEQFAAGHRDDPWALIPQYHRGSAAEERLSSKHQPPATSR